MGLEIVTEAFIEQIKLVEKRVINRLARVKIERGHQTINYQLVDDNGNNYRLYKRQNKKSGMADSFSCGLILFLPSGESFTLARYNGPSHTHTNKLDRTRIVDKPHVHLAKVEYLEKTGRADGFAIASSEYHTLEGALFCILRDYNITGLTAIPDELSLFDNP